MNNAAIQLPTINSGATLWCGFLCLIRT